MNRSKYIIQVGILLVIIFISARNVSAQFLDNVHLDVEAGFTYNQLYLHSHKYIIGVSPTATTIPAKTENRTHFEIFPAIQLGLNINPPFIKLLNIEPFIGYNETGGESGKQSNGYQDKYLFRTLSPGLFADIHLRRYEFGAGIRYDIYLARYDYSYGTLNGTINGSTTWKRYSANFLTKNHSWMAGLKISRTIWHALSLQASGWYGLNNIASKQADSLDKIRSVQFRLMLCYQL